MEIKGYLGDVELLHLSKTAFLCSREVPASIVLKCYDWAIEQREKGTCLISGFHSKIEKDVLHYLLAGAQPVIMALARGMKDEFNPEIKEAIYSGRLLIITPFEKDVQWVTVETAEARNRFMIEIADDIVIGYASKSGIINKMLKDIKNKKVYCISQS